MKKKNNQRPIMLTTDTLANYHTPYQFHPMTTKSIVHPIIWYFRVSSLELCQNVTHFVASMRRCTAQKLKLRIPGWSNSLGKPVTASIRSFDRLIDNFQFVRSSGELKKIRGSKCVYFLCMDSYGAYIIVYVYSIYACMHARTQCMCCHASIDCIVQNMITMLQKYE